MEVYQQQLENLKKQIEEKKMLLASTTTTITTSTSTVPKLKAVSDQQRIENLQRQIKEKRMSLNIQQTFLSRVGAPTPTPTVAAFLGEHQVNTIDVGNSRKRRFDEAISSSSSSQSRAKHASWEQSSSSSSSAADGRRYDHVMELKVPDSKIGYVIGKGGEMLFRLQASTPDVLIEVIDSNDDMRTIIVRGDNQKSLDACKWKVDEIMKIKDANQPYWAFLKVLSPFMTHIEVPREHVGLVIGRQGKVIRCIKERYGRTSSSLPSPSPSEYSLTSSVRALIYIISTECQIEIADEPDINNPTIGTCYIGSNTKEGMHAARIEIAQILRKARGGADVRGDDDENIKMRKRIRQTRNRFLAKKGPQLPPCPDLSIPTDASSSVAWDRLLRWEKDCEHILRANDMPCPKGFVTQPQIPGNRPTNDGGYQCSDCDEVFKKPAQCLHHMHTTDHETGLMIMRQCLKDWQRSKSRRKNKELEHARNPLLQRIFDSEDPDEIRAACAEMDKKMDKQDREIYGDDYYDYEGDDCGGMFGSYTMNRWGYDSGREGSDDAMDW